MSTLPFPFPAYTFNNGEVDIMSKAMKARNILLLLSTLSLPLANAPGQDSGQELPSAPSASKQQRDKPPAPAAPSPQSSSTSAPAQNRSTVDPSPAVPMKSSTESDQAGGSRSGDETPPRSEEDNPTTIRRTVNEVNVVFTVTDRHGRYVKDLKRDDFKVIDDNKPAAEIRSFSRQTNLPLRGRTAGGCQQFGARPLQVRTGIGGGVSQ